MDAVSHALIGLAVAGLSGHQPAINDPIYISSVIGAQSPDFDIITYLHGNMSYLKHHRVYSHSIASLFIWAGLITLGTYLFLPVTDSLQVFFWAFAGALTHILIDYFTTHGISWLWPLDLRRKSCHLLNVFDPLLFTGMISLYIFQFPMLVISLLTLSGISFYIGLRYLLRQQASIKTKEHFLGYTISRILIMPSQKKIWYWDFFLETDNGFSLGQIGLFSNDVKVLVSLPKSALSVISLEAQKTLLGEFFSKFTPFMYLKEESQDAGWATVHIYDLRYFLNESFLHSATVIFENNAPCLSYIHTTGKTIKIPCLKQSA